MIFDLMQKGIVCKKTLLIQNYKKIEISENQLVIILLIMELSKSNNKVLTPTYLSNYMNIQKDDIERELASLIDNSLISFQVEKKENKIDLSPLFDKLIIQIESEQLEVENDTIIKLIEKNFNKNLTNFELGKLNELIYKGIEKKVFLSYFKKPNVITVEDFLEKIEADLKPEKKVKLSRYNWLNE